MSHSSQAGPPHSFVVESSQRIESGIENVWRCITDVDLSAYPHPAIFKVLGVPRPLRAELRGDGVGAERTAWFDNGKRFTQVVSEWRPPAGYRFSFQADPGFRAGYLFDLSRGPFRMVEGWYRLEALGPKLTAATLGSRYLCSIHPLLVIPWIIAKVLPAYQSFLLRMIKSNCEDGGQA
jgi:hypothetical protein